MSDVDNNNESNILNHNDPLQENPIFEESPLFRPIPRNTTVVIGVGAKTVNRSHNNSASSAPFVENVSFGTATNNNNIIPPYSHNNSNNNHNTTSTATNTKNNTNNLINTNNTSMTTGNMIYIESPSSSSRRRGKTINHDVEEKSPDILMPTSYSRQISNNHPYPSYNNNISIQHSPSNKSNHRQKVNSSLSQSQLYAVSNTKELAALDLALHGYNLPLKRSVIHKT